MRVTIVVAMVATASHAIPLQQHSLSQADDQFIGNLINKAKDAVDYVGDKVGDAVGYVGDKASNLATGAWNGATAAASRVRGWFKDLLGWSDE